MGDRLLGGPPGAGGLRTTTWTGAAGTASPPRPRPDRRPRRRWRSRPRPSRSGVRHGQTSPRHAEGGRCHGGPSSLVCAHPCAPHCWHCRVRPAHGPDGSCAFASTAEARAVRGGRIPPVRVTPQGEKLLVRRGRAARWAGRSVTRRDGRPGRGGRRWGPARVPGGAQRLPSVARHGPTEVPPAHVRRPRPASPPHGARRVSATPAGRAAARRAALDEGRRGGRPAPRRPQRAVGGGPPAGVVSRLPGTGSSLALTVDDGTSSEVVAALVELAADRAAADLLPERRLPVLGRQRTGAAPADRVRPGRRRQPHLVAPGPDHAGRRPDRRPSSPATRRSCAPPWASSGTPFFRPPFGCPRRPGRPDRRRRRPPHRRPLVRHAGRRPGAHPRAADRRGADLVPAAAHRDRARQPPGGRPVTDQLVELIHARRLQTVTLADVWPARR